MKKGKVKDFVEHQGQRFSLEAWFSGIDERDPENKQYKFGIQIYQIPMSYMIRFDDAFIKDLFGNNEDTDNMTTHIFNMVRDHLGVFMSGRAPRELCEKWLAESIVDEEAKND